MCLWLPPGSEVDVIAQKLLRGTNPRTPYSSLRGQGLIRDQHAMLAMCQPAPTPTLIPNLRDSIHPITLHAKRGHHRHFLCILPWRHTAYYVARA